MITIWGIIVISVVIRKCMIISYSDFPFDFNANIEYSLRSRLWQILWINLNRVITDIHDNTPKGRKDILRSWPWILCWILCAIDLIPLKFQVSTKIYIKLSLLSQYDKASLIFKLFRDFECKLVVTLSQGWFYAANWLILANFDQNFVIPWISVNQVRKCWSICRGVLTAKERPFKCQKCSSFRGLCPLDPRCYCPCI